MEVLSSLTFGQIAWGIITVAVAGVALKVIFTLKFDINKWQEYRVETIQRKLQMNCTHTLLNMTEDGAIEIQSLFTSPSGTHMWVCSRCSTSIYDEEHAKRIAVHYANNLSEYTALNKRFNKLVKKIS